MKRIIIGLCAFVLALGLGFNAGDAEAKRLGSGSSFGMSRNTAPMQRQYSAPPQQANPAPAQAAPTPAPQQPQPSGARRWLGPLAGLAAGIGIAALLSHFGLGEGAATLFMIVALAFLAMFVLRLLFGRKEPQRPVYAGNIGGQTPSQFHSLQPGASGATLEAPAVPTGFDTTGFLRQAKLNFTRLQAANDAGNMDDIKAFTTPEVFAEVEMQYQERGRSKQQTDVVQLDADVVEVVTEEKRHVASVRFHGLIREEPNAPAEPFDEVWHLTKPTDGSEGWRVAGIQQIR